MDPEALARMKALRESHRAKLEAEQQRNRAIAQAWDAWITSEQGEKCLDEKGCFGEYLRNRLWHAFMAGADSVKREDHSEGK